MVMLLGVIPPFLRQTDDNPKGVPGPMFEDIKAAIAADRYAELTVVEVENGPHNVGWTHPEVTNAPMLAFLA